MDSREIDKRVEKAMQAVLRSDGLKIKTAARQYGVPYDRLYQRVKGVPSRFGRTSPNRRLNATQEAGLCKFLDHLGRLDVFSTQKEVEEAANSLLNEGQKRRAAPNGETEPPLKVGAQWVRRFLQRHPQYKRSRERIIDAERRAAEDPEGIQEYFNKLRTAIEEHDVQPGDIYSVDECAFRIGVVDNSWVVSREQTRRGTIGRDDSQEIIGVVECVSATGHVVPPMLIVPSKSYREKWCAETDVEPEYLVTASTARSVTPRLMVSWLEHFDKMTRLRKTGRYRLLLVEGRDSHFTYEFLKAAEEKEIVIFCMPAHTRHILQPLEVVIFQPHEHLHSVFLDRSTGDGISKFTKTEFIHAFRQIRGHTFVESTIQAAFRDTGIWPLDPAVVVDPLKQRRQVRQDEEEEDEEQLRAVEPRTPTTEKSLNHQFERLRDDTPKTLKCRLGKILKGTSIAMYETHLLKEHIAKLSEE